MWGCVCSIFVYMSMWGCVCACGQSVSVFSCLYFHYFVSLSRLFVCLCLYFCEAVNVGQCLHVFQTVCVFVSVFMWV